MCSTPHVCHTHTHTMTVCCPFRNAAWRHAMVCYTAGLQLPGHPTTAGAAASPAAASTRSASAAVPAAAAAGVQQCVVGGSAQRRTAATDAKPQARKHTACVAVRVPLKGRRACIGTDNAVKTVAPSPPPQKNKIHTPPHVAHASFLFPAPGRSPLAPSPPTPCPRLPRLLLAPLLLAPCRLPAYVRGVLVWGSPPTAGPGAAPAPPPPTSNISTSALPPGTTCQAAAGGTGTGQTCGVSVVYCCPAAANGALAVAVPPDWQRGFSRGEDLQEVLGRFGNGSVSAEEQAAGGGGGGEAGGANGAGGGDAGAVAGRAEPGPDRDVGGTAGPGGGGLPADRAAAGWWGAGEGVSGSGTGAEPERRFPCN